MYNLNELPAADMGDYIFMAPNAPKVFNEDGTLNWMPNSSGSSTWLNPMAYLYNTYENKATNIIGNININYNILTGVQLKINTGYTSLQNDEVRIDPWIAVPPDGRSLTPRVSNFSHKNLKTWIVEPQVNIYKKIGKLKD